MKKIIYAITALAIVSCKKEVIKPIDYAIFSGNITNINTDSVYVRGKDFKKAIPVKKDGTFTDTLQVTNGNYVVKIGVETTDLIFNQGDQIHLNIDTKKFDESIEYTGKGAGKNNYLAKAYLLDEVFTNKREEIYKLELDDFIKKTTELETATQNLLTTNKIEDSIFIAKQKRNNHYNFLSKVKSYPGYQKRILQKEVTLPKIITEDIENLDFDIAIDFDNSDAYKQIVTMEYYTRAGKLKKEDSLLSLPMAFTKTINTFKSNNIKDYFINMSSRFIKPGNHEAETIYKKLVSLTKDSKLIESLGKKLENTKKFAAGKTSPIFENYENSKGGHTSLNDLKGKFVYIDVWATWCGPCKREIPFLQKVEKEYHNKNIEFVSISVDRSNAHQAWIDMVKEKELGGIQLFADKAFDSKFIKAYGINSIPRFILLDPKGNIVNAAAPRPSSPELKDLLKAQGI